MVQTVKTNIAFVSTALPPSASGQGKVLERLVVGRPENNYWFFSDNAETFTQKQGEELGAYIQLKPRLAGLINWQFRNPIGNVNRLVGYRAASKMRAREIVDSLRNSQLDAIVGCSGNPFDLMAACLAARQLDVPFIAYLFDDPVFQWPAGELRSLARRLECVWSNRAHTIVCPNEVLASEVMKRTGREAVIVRNPTNDSHVGNAAEIPVEPDGVKRVVYTGSIYHAHKDAFERLVAAVNMHEGRYRIDIYSHQQQEMLAGYGLTGAHVRWNSYLGDAQVAAVQRSAHILFLPLAFNSNIQDVLMSSAPAKMGEYLIAGRPVLAHAPAGSFVSSFFRERRAGYVVDEPSVSGVAEALKVLVEDQSLATEFVANALKAAKGFTIEESRRSFWGILDSASRAAGRT